MPPLETLLNGRETYPTYIFHNIEFLNATAHASLCISCAVNELISSTKKIVSVRFFQFKHVFLPNFHLLFYVKLGSDKSFLWHNYFWYSMKCLLMLGAYFVWRRRKKYCNAAIKDKNKKMKLNYLQNVQSFQCLTMQREKEIDIELNTREVQLLSYLPFGSHLSFLLFI